MKKYAFGILVFLACFVLTIGLCAAQDLIYVVERGSGQLSVIDKDGTISMLTSGLLDPLDVEILPNGNLLVSERVSYSSTTGYLTEIALDGTWISQEPTAGFSPTDIFVDYDGTIYVSSIFNGIWKKAPGESSFAQFSLIFGDPCDIIRLGNFIYVVDAYGAHGLWQVDPSTGDATPVLSSVFSTALGLAIWGDDLLVTDHAGTIWLVTGLPNSASLSAFATGVTSASSFTIDNEGNIVLSHQMPSGAISKIDSLGNVIPFVSSTSLLSSPRGLDFLTRVMIDIKPGSDPNSINLGEHGVLPIAVLGALDFDVTIINPATIEIGGVSLKERGSKKAPKLAYSYEDVNGDGFTDMMTFFEVEQLVSQGVLLDTTIELLLSGTLYSGSPIFGSDAVRIVH